MRLVISRFSCCCECAPVGDNPDVLCWIRDRLAEEDDKM